MSEFYPSVSVRMVNMTNTVTCVSHLECLELTPDNISDQQDKHDEVQHPQQRPEDRTDVIDHELQHFMMTSDILSNNPSDDHSSGALGTVDNSR